MVWEHQGIQNSTSIIGQPKVAADGNLVLIPYSNGDIFALNLTNGAELWRQSTVSIEQSETSNSFSDIDANPVILKNLIIVASTNGKIFAFNNKAREGARVVKEYLLKAVKDKKNWKCPYCNIKKDIFKSEGDHIHPVSKGGLSTSQNMTLICKPCNKNKKTSTLRSFSKKFQLDYERICRRLELEGKDV